jgi:hypothetical protein
VPGGEMANFVEFLKRNTVKKAGVLPLVHTTRAQHLRKVMQSDRIVAGPCDVFKGLNLNYFFVGRPAFKRDINDEAEYWQLPSCFIFEFSAIKFQRVFPFDTGGFARKLYPDYIREYELADFEASSVPDAPARIIGAFFGTASRYWNLNAKDKAAFETEFSLDVFDDPIRALHKLSTDSTRIECDDRRFVVEAQSTNDIDLKVVKPLAVVAPSSYFDNLEFRNKVTQEWRAVPLDYALHPLSVNQYYGIIYERVFQFYKTKNLL